MKTGGPVERDGLALCSLTYEVDGVRVAKWGNSELSSYLLDKNPPYTQAPEESYGVGAL